MESVELMMQKKYIDTSWDFSGGSEKNYTHDFHTYPAMMIPPIAKRLIETYDSDSTVILDPFVGSGTVLVEASIHDNFHEAYGVDINPLARFISKVKTTVIEPYKLSGYLEKIMNASNLDRFEGQKNKYEKPVFFNIDFWFKPQVILELTILKTHINEIEDTNIRDFFLVIFSEIVRKVSNTRNGEFKLYRMPGEKLKSFEPNTFQEFYKKALSNIDGMKEYILKRSKNCKTVLLDEDSRFTFSIPDKSVDILVTSPPYGDSRTTVAYGQFSRLALQWLGISEDKVSEIDKISLGGKPSKNLDNHLRSERLEQVLEQIKRQDEKRARDVLSFYIDFNECIKQFDRVIENKGILCFVVGNRTVKNVKIPTDEILVELFQDQGNYSHLNTFIRNIPNKRMPKKNSPSNVKGELVSTMNEEYIVVLEKND